jgi:parallel beta-helix repeat protein
MALSINQKGTVALASVAGATFTAKLQNAGSSSIYPEGTVFDCSSYKSDTITATVIIRRAGTTFLFGEGDFTMSVSSQNMFEIQAPNVTIIGVSRSAKDSVSTNGSTRFVMTSTNGGYHVITTPTSGNAWASSDSLTIMNVDLVGVKSVYTSNNGTASFSTQGSGGILLTEGNPDASGSNLNNIWINEVLIDGARRHGIMMYGGMASKIQNTRVRNAGGHGFYIAGSTTSTSLDTCYASGCYLAGFCINDTSYSTLSNCASDSNGLGYWMRNANSVTMSSCGAEANQVRSSIPNSLGITLPAQAGTVTINDIGSDNVNFIKGTSFLFTGGSNITGSSCYSKDPGNSAGLPTFASKYTAHIHGAYGTEKVNMDNFKATGDSTVKYEYRLEDANNFHIDDLVNTYDPTNPIESPNGSNVTIAAILDQGVDNIFGDAAYSHSFYGRRIGIVDSESNYRVNQLNVPGRLNIPVEPAHPADPQSGSIYFNNVLNKLFMFSGTAWFDTCCGTAPTPAPECVFPNGGITEVTPGIFPANTARLGNKVYMLSGGTSGTLGVFDISTEQFTVILNEANLPKLAPDRNFVMGMGLAYNSANNCLYFTYCEIAGTEATNNPENYLGDAHHIVKYDITANTTTVKSIVQNDLVTYEDPTTSYSRYQFYVYDGSLHGITNSLGPFVTNQRSLNIIIHDLETLDSIDYIEGADMTAEVTFIGVGGGVDAATDAGFKYEFADQTGNMLIRPSRYSVGEIPYLYLVNLTGGTYSKREFGTEVIPDMGTGPTIVGSILTIAASEEGTYFVTNSLEGKFYEMEYTSFTPLLTRTIGNCGFMIERQVNGNRLLFYRKNTWSEVTTSLITAFSCYNLTTDEFLGDVIASTSSGQSYFVNSILSNSYYGPPIDGGSLYPFIYSSGGSLTKIIKFCAPYVV